MKIMPLTLAIVALTWAFACKRSADDTSTSLKTDLKDNQTVSRTFSDYKRNSEHCGASEGDHKRVMVTGFALFGDDFNISGISTMSMANPDFWPGAVNLSDATPASEKLTQFAKHAGLKTTHGGLVRQRKLTIDEETYDVCFLYLDVKWDLAAAIILYEANLFRPDLVIMSGVNGSEETTTIWESGALNNATLYAGFNQEGTPSPNNVPTRIHARILETHAFNHAVDLTWNATTLSKENADLIGAIDLTKPYKTDVGKARDTNNYICNNVSYAVTMGLTGHDVKLAGELIELKGANFGTKTGFLHYPSRSSKTDSADNGTHIYGWNKVLAQTIKISLKS